MAFKVPFVIFNKCVFPVRLSTTVTVSLSSRLMLENDKELLVLSTASLDRKSSFRLLIEMRTQHAQSSLCAVVHVLQTLAQSQTEKMNFPTTFLQLFFERGKRFPEFIFVDQIVMDAFVVRKETKKDEEPKEDGKRSREAPTEEKDSKKLKTEVKLRLIPIKDGKVRWCAQFLSKTEADDLMKHLLEEMEWTQGEISMYGKKVKTPRLQSWMADESVNNVGLYQSQKQRPWTPPVQRIRESIESILQCKFDYVLINYYRNGQDYISFHADREAIPEGKNIIASLSLGATRRFILKHQIDATETIELSLLHGSLVTMEETTQQFWKHSVPKEKSVTLPRINLTFRIQ